jgi:hypothetical protein
MSGGVYASLCITRMYAQKHGYIWWFLGLGGGGRLQLENLLSKLLAVKRLFY